MPTLDRRTRRLTLLLLVTLLMLTATAACGGGSSETSDEPLDPPPTVSETVGETVEEPTETVIEEPTEAVSVEQPTEEVVAEEPDENGEQPEDDPTPAVTTAPPTPTPMPVVTTAPPTPAPVRTPTPRPTPDFGSVAYDVPTEMVRGEIVNVILLISPDEDESEALTRQLTEELAEVDQTPSNIITATVRTGRRMSARLTSSPENAFHIRRVETGETQFFDETDPQPIKWEWEVTPQLGGTHRLLLVIERVQTVDGETAFRAEETLRREIDVEVTPGQRVADFAASPLGIGAFLGLLAVLGLLLARRRRLAAPVLGGGALSREQLHRVTPILADALAQLTAEQRVAFLSQAGVGQLVDVDLNGSARTVAMTILSELNQYGEMDDGRPAIALLLDYLAANPALPRRDKETLDGILAQTDQT